MEDKHLVSTHRYVHMERGRTEAGADFMFQANVDGSCKEYLCFESLKFYEEKKNEL